MRATAANTGIITPEAEPLAVVVLFFFIRTFLSYAGLMLLLFLFQLYNTFGELSSGGDVNEKFGIVAALAARIGKDNTKGAAMKFHSSPLILIFSFLCIRKAFDYSAVTLTASAALSDVHFPFTYACTPYL